MLLRMTAAALSDAWLRRKESNSPAAFDTGEAINYERIERNVILHVFGGAGALM